MSVGRWIAGLVRRGGAEEPERAPPEHVEPEAEQEPEPQAEPEAVVNERSARALLASATPPLPPEPSKPARRRRLERRPEPRPAEPEPVVVAAEPREWNIWELQRAVRDADDPAHQEEWSALLIHLREFANADGNLPVEFDALVRESFADVLEPEAAAS
jgi:hypothetical protein